MDPTYIAPQLFTSLLHRNASRRIGQAQRLKLAFDTFSSHFGESVLIMLCSHRTNWLSAFSQRQGGIICLIFKLRTVGGPFFSVVSYIIAQKPGKVAVQWDIRRL